MDLQARTAWLLRRLPRRTVRVRLILLCGGLFLAAGAGLLTLTDVLVARAILGSSPSARLLSSGRAIVVSVGGPPTQLTGDPGYLINEARLQAAADVHSVIVVSGIAMGVTVVVSAALGWVVAGRVLRPLQRMTTATRQISEHSLHERLPADGPADELTGLAITINELLARLQSAFDAQRRFVANASHELRTPLAAMRTSVDVATGKPGLVPREVTVLAGKLRESLDQSDRLLESLLTLARSQDGGTGEPHPLVCLGRVLAAAIRAHSAVIAGKDITVEAAGDGWVRGDDALLTRLVDNLIDNAIRHNEPGGWVRAKITTDETTTRLTVKNGGPVLGQETVRELGRPFRRLGADRTGSADGTGLGLSIVEAVASAHGGSVHLHAQAEGGLRVVVELPVARPPAPEPVGAGARG